MKKKEIVWITKLFLASGLLLASTAPAAESGNGSIVNIASGSTSSHAIAVGPGSQAVAGGISINGQNMTSTGNLIQDIGISKTEKRPLASYHSVKIENFPGEVTLHFGKESSAIIKADQAMIPTIRTRVTNDTLFIEITESISTNTPLQLHLNTEKLSSLRLDGTGDAALENISTDRLYLETNGSGSIIAQGKARQLEVILSGSGDINTDKLITKQCAVKIEGAGDVTVHTTDVLTAEINGAGDIIYSGNPLKVMRNINGAGNIEPASY